LMGFVFNWGGASRGSAQAKGGTGGEGSGGGGQHGSRGGTGEEVPSGGGTGGEGPGGVGGTGEEGPGEGKLDGCIMHQVHTSIYKFACLSVSLSVEVLKPSVRLSRSWNPGLESQMQRHSRARADCVRPSLVPTSSKYYQTFHCSQNNTKPAIVVIIDLISLLFGFAAWVGI
jgi:hypothetical protein